MWGKKLEFTPQPPSPPTFLNQFRQIRQSELKRNWTWYKKTHRIPLKNGRISCLFLYEHIIMDSAISWRESSVAQFCRLFFLQQNQIIETLWFFSFSQAMPLTGLWKPVVYQHCNICLQMTVLILACAKENKQECHIIQHLKK